MIDLYESFALKIKKIQPNDENKYKEENGGPILKPIQKLNSKSKLKTLNSILPIISTKTLTHKKFCESLE